MTWLRQRVPAERLLPGGFEDDAALLDFTQSPQCVVTVDMITDGVDFILSEVDPRRVGHKALAVNLSDLAAMAARPLAIVVSLALPRTEALSLAQQLYEGMLPLAERFDVTLAGGDTNTWDGPLAISVTALGTVGPGGPLRRTGAQPGDAILVTGTLGGSILGRHLDVEPRVEEALTLQQRYTLHAGMDISDGLALDLSRLATASRCGAVLDLSKIPISADAERLAAQRGDGVTPLEHALGDGEDFELLLTLPAAEAERVLAEQPLAVPVARIGECIAEPGLWQRDASGTRQPLAARGFEH